MAWIPTTQFTATLAGATIEYGYVTLTTALEYVEVTTRLKVIDSAQVTYREAPDAATRLYCDGTITAGAVTITDVEGAETNDRIVNYMFIGH